MAMTREQALRVLGLEGNPPQEQIDSVYRHQLTKCHVDHDAVFNDEEKDKRGKRREQLADARNVLTTYHQDKLPHFLEDALRRCTEEGTELQLLGLNLSSHTFSADLEREKVEVERQLREPYVDFSNIISLNQRLLLIEHAKTVKLNLSIPLFKYIESCLHEHGFFEQVPTVIKLHAKKDGAGICLLDNQYTLNANNYTAYELMWVYKQLLDNNLKIKGILKFAEPNNVSPSRKLMLELINAQLKFPEGCPDLSKQVMEKITKHMSKFKYAGRMIKIWTILGLVAIIPTVITAIVLAITISLLFLTLPLVPVAMVAIPIVIGALIFLKLSATERAINQTLSKVLVPVTDRTLGQLKQSVKDASKISDESALKERSFSVSERMSQLFSRNTAVAKYMRSATPVASVDAGAPARVVAPEEYTPFPELSDQEKRDAEDQKREKKEAEFIRQQDQTVAAKLQPATPIV